MISNKTKFELDYQATKSKGNFTKREPLPRPERKAPTYTQRKVTAKPLPTVSNNDLEILSSLKSRLVAYMKKEREMENKDRAKTIKAL